MLRRALLGIAVVLAACGDNRDVTWPYYAWSGTPAAVGAYSIDHLLPDDAAMLHNVDLAAESGEVVLFYGHLSAVGSSVDTIEALVAYAEVRGVPSLSFADLASGPPRGGICLSFDDTEVDAWYALEPMLARHGAHVTFFVTRYAQLTDEQRAKLHELSADGHSIEAHGVNHLGANDYIAQYGMQAYIDDEVLPSIQILRDDGFQPVAYAHPGGSHTDALDDALAAYIPFVRGISGRPK